MLAGTYCPAQELPGKWKGYFIPNNNVFGKVYQYEMNITKGEKELQITTHTKLNVSFSAQAYAKGYFDKKTLLVQIEEQGFMDLQIQANHSACLMNNFLVYRNLRGHEIIEGTYTSYNKLNGKDCGGGKVYLEKEIPIHQQSIAEKMYVEKQKNSKIPPSITTKPTISHASANIKEEPKIVKPSPLNTENLHAAIQKAQVSNDIAEAIVEDTLQAIPENIESEIRIRQGNGFQSIPWVLVGRENKLAKKIATSSKQFSIDLYDNGTIDNDTIIVYDNKKLLVSKKRLSYKAIHLEFALSDIVNEHEIIIVAHNMGTVPPNTALLVLKDGFNRQELFITSTNKINAKIIVSYQPPN